mmetsp:Transcript_424/g.784  ORF Transcript_424/g.784 Transcript_424/m.784 type:complete len:269 (+) Transcript_424:30-836(+)
MAAAAATSLGVPTEKLAAFTEVYEAQGPRGARRWKEFLSKVRSAAEVEQRIAERPELLAGHPPETLARAKERLIFCGRYSAKVQTPLDSALDDAVAGISRARETLAVGKLRMIVAFGTFGDEHLACRGQAFPYKPSVSACHGSKVIEARAVHETAVNQPHELLGYVAMQGGGYVDDIAVFPKFHGQRVATSLLAGAAAAEKARGGRQLCLDVRAANTPAISLYKALGFAFGPLEHPGFLDWDGGYQGEADAAAVLAKLPETADISSLR